MARCAGAVLVCAGVMCSLFVWVACDVWCGMVWRGVMIEVGGELGAGVARISGQSAAIPTTRLIRHDRKLLKKNHESFFF